MGKGKSSKGWCKHVCDISASLLIVLFLSTGVSEWSARLRERNPSLQVLLSVGGVGSEGVVKSLDKRSRFVASVGQVVRQAGLQGLELNLDLAPNAGPHGKERLVDLLKALRSELGGNANSRPKRDHRMTDIQDDKETTQQPIRANLTSTSRQSRRTDGTTSRKNRLEDELTTNSDGFLLLRVPTEPEILVKRYDLKNISKYVDFLTVPTHNLSDATERGLTYHPSRLMGLADILNTDSMLDLLTGLGAPHNMIIISIPASGTSFTLKDPEQNTPRSPASSGPKRISQGKGKRGGAGREILGTTSTLGDVPDRPLCSLLSEGGWTMERDEDLTAPYAFRNNTWLAFEDNISAGIKGKYVLLRDLAGAAVFPVDDDDLEDSCAPFTSNKTTEEGGGVKGKTRHLPWLVASLHDTFTHLARQSRQVVLENLQEQIKQSTLLTFSGDIQLSPYRITRIVDTLGAVHVVRKEARTQFECSRQGYFVHPLGCNSCGAVLLLFLETGEAMLECGQYPSSRPSPFPPHTYDFVYTFYRCVKFNQYSADFTVFEYDCPAGLAFDERWEVCVWPGSLPRGSPCTGSSEIAPVPRARYACPAVEGYYADPENCRWFFACLDHARDGATALTAYEFRCPFGLVFDERKLVCDWPWLVGGCGSGYGGGAYFGAVQLDRGAYYGASNAAGVGVGLAGSRGYNAADFGESARLQGAGRGGNLAIVGAGRGDSLATLNGPGYVATGANIATIGVQPISGSGLGSGRVYTSGAGVGIGAATGAGRGRVQYGSGEGSAGIFSSGGFGNAGVAAGESFGNVGGASSSYDQDRNIPSFAALPDSYVSGGRIDNTGGVVLETNLVGSGYAGGNQGGNGLAFVPAESPRSAVVKTFNSPATSFRRPQVNIVQPQAQLVPAVAIDTSNTQFVQSTPTPFYSISSTPRPFYSISSTPRPFYSLSSTPQPQGSDVFLDTPRSPLVEKVSFYQSTPKTSYRRPQAQFVQTVVETPSVPVIQQGSEISFVSTTPRPVQRRPVIQQNQFVQPIPVAVNTPVVTYQSTPRPVYGPPLVAKTQLLEGVFGARGVPLVHQSPATTFVQTGPQITFRETKKEFVQPLVQVTSSPVVQPIIADTARVSYKRPVVPQLQYEPNIVRTPLVQEAVSDGQPQVFDNAEVSFIQSTPRPSYRRPIVTQTQTPLFQQAVVGAPQQSSFQTSYRNKIVKAFPSVQTIVQAPQIPVVQNVPVATYNAQDISRTVTSVPVTTYRRPVTRLRPTVQSLPLTPTANSFQGTDKTGTFDYAYDQPAVIRARPQGFGYNSGVGYVSSTARPTDFVTVSTPKTPAFISGGSQGYTSSSGAVFSTPISLQEAEVPFVGYEGDFGAKTSFFRDGLAPSYQQDNLSSNQSSYRFGQGLNVRQRLRTPIEGGERGVVFTQGEGYQFNQRLVPLAPAISAPQSVAYSTRGSYSGGRRRPADISNGQVYPTTFRPTVVSTYSTTAPEVFLPSLSTPIFRSSTVAPISFVSSTPKTVTYPQDYVISAPKSVSNFSPSVTNSYSQTRPSRVRVASQSTTTDTYVNSSPGYSSSQGQVRKGNANKDRISGDRTGTLDENVDVLLNKYSGNFGGILNNNNNNEGFISDVIEGDLARKDGGRAGSRGRLELSTLAPNIDSTTSIGRGRVGGFTSKTQGSRLSAANRGNGGYGDNLSSDISTDDDKTELGTATIYDADGGVQFEAVKIGYGKTKGSREPIVVVTRLSDVNPILVAKLGAQCTCTKSTTELQVKRPESDRGPTYRGYSSSPDYGIIDGVSSTTSLPILTSSYSPREYVSPTTLSGRPYNVPRGNGFRSNVSPGVTLVTQAPTLSSVLLSEYPSSSTPRIVGIKSREQLVSPVVSIAPQPSSIFLTGAPTVVSLSPQPSVLVDTTSRRVPISSDRSSGYPRRRPDVDGSSNYRPGAGYGSGPRDELSGSPSSDDSVRTGGGPILGGVSGPGLRGSSKSGLRGGSGSGLGDASRSGAAAGASFDRYGPGGLRGVDETLQGSVDCQRPGLFRHPKYCNKFYACHWDEWKNRYTLHVFNCPVQLAYDSSLGACNWPSQGPACSDDNLLV
ncbi:unnamed protein product [Timema podura]|uniref:Chitinase n=1 Tax=Timema podura TaxID=61482 RepID=A0ABN7NCC5_TIMPD|nr:unnamed protein product [Timema podura]